MSQGSYMISATQSRQPFGNPSANVNVSTQMFRIVDLSTLNRRQFFQVSALLAVYLTLSITPLSVFKVNPVFQLNTPRYKFFYHFKIMESDSILAMNNY